MCTEKVHVDVKYIPFIITIGPAALFACITLILFAFIYIYIYYYDKQGVE
jgi:hypothetical protein